MTTTSDPPGARARSRALGRAAAILLLLTSCGPALAGILLCLQSSGGIEAVGTFSAALAFGAAAALLPVRGGHGGRGGPLLPLTLAVTALGSGAATLASGLRAAGVEGDPWLDVLGVAWMPGGLTVSGVLAAAVLLRARSLLATGGLLSTAIAIASAVPLDRGTAPATEVLWLVWLGLALGSGTVVLWVARRRPPPDKDAAVWLAIAHFAMLICGVGGFVVGTRGVSLLGTTLAAAFVPACVLFAAAAFLLTAIARAPGAVDPRHARFAVGVLLVSALLVGYGAVATTIAQVAPLPPTTAGLVTVVLLAIGVEPVRRGVQRAVDQLLYGRSADPRALLRTVSAEAAASGNGSLDALAEALRQALRLEGVAVESTTGVRAQAGVVEPTTSRTVTLLAADGPCGTVEVSGAAGRRIDPRTITAVQRIGGVLSVAVLLAEVDEDLRLARERARRIAASERRFARAEIEAGVEPALRRIREDLRRLPTAADAGAVLHRAATLVQAATTEVRDLARTLLPGSLDAGDLPGALGELADRFDHPELVADVRRPPRHPENVYHLVAEAVLRARREGGVERIEVTVGAEDGTVLLILGDAERTAPIVHALRLRAEEARVGADESTTVGTVITGVER